MILPDQELILPLIRRNLVFGPLLVVHCRPDELFNLLQVIVVLAFRAVMFSFSRCSNFKSNLKSASRLLYTFSSLVRTKTSLSTAGSSNICSRKYVFFRLIWHWGHGAWPRMKRILTQLEHSVWPHSFTINRSVGLR